MSTAFDVPFSIATHGGYITVKSKANGEHRTFRVRRQKEDAYFMPGTRLAAMRTGSDNENDYTAFGIVTDDGRIVLWKKHLNNQFYQWVAKCLMHPKRHLDKVEFNFDARCRRCNRHLTTSESVRLGLGPDCAQIEGMA